MTASSEMHRARKKTFDVTKLSMYQLDFSDLSLNLANAVSAVSGEAAQSTSCNF